MSGGRLPRILFIDEPLPAGLDPVRTLGGKAAGLVAMAQELKLPVPPAFVLPTEVCHQFLAAGWPEGLEEEVRAAVAGLERRTGRTFGRGPRPLLVSVRSGAPVSMPGMMDTVLNVGMTPDVRRALEEESGDPRFAADTWLRFHRMYAETVLGVPREEVEHAAVHDGTPGGMVAAGERVRELARAYGGVPADPFRQLLEAIQAVFRSWESDRARVFRAREGIDDSLGTAATVQAMVFGNLDDGSGTGVAFSRDPVTGERGAFGDYLPRAQGEDVVAGTHHVQGLDLLRQQLPEAYEELLRCLQVLERHHRDMCDVEFTVSGGRLYILQTRVGRRSPLAAVRIAVDMALDPSFPLTKEDAVQRVGPEVLQAIAEMADVDPAAEPLARGIPASPGVGVGELVCSADRAAELAAEGRRVVLARPETSPGDVHGMVVSAGLVTTRGGALSHAAVVARSWAMPCVCSLEGAEVAGGALVVGGRRIPEGTVVTVDGTRGLLFLGDQRRDGRSELPELDLIRAWAAELSERSGDGSGEREVSEYEVLRALQLKGLASAERLAEVLDTSAERVRAVLSARPELVRETPRGFAMLPAGREYVLSLLEEERQSVDRARMEALLQRFSELDEELKALVTGWQRAEDQSEHAWAEVVGRLAQLHERLEPVLEEAAALVPRLARFGARLGLALEAVRRGDRSMLAAPLAESYHTVWFELHEELIALSGRSRQPAG